MPSAAASSSGAASTCGGSVSSNRVAGGASTVASSPMAGGAVIAKGASGASSGSSAATSLPPPKQPRDGAVGQEQRRPDRDGGQQDQEHDGQEQPGAEGFARRFLRFAAQEAVGQIGCPPSRPARVASACPVAPASIRPAGLQAQRFAKRREAALVPVIERAPRFVIAAALRGRLQTLVRGRACRQSGHRGPSRGSAVWRPPSHRCRERCRRQTGKAALALRRHGRRRPCGWVARSVWPSCGGRAPCWRRGRARGARPAGSAPPGPPSSCAASSAGRAPAPVSASGAASASRAGTRVRHGREFRRRGIEAGWPRGAAGAASSPSASVRWARPVRSGRDLPAAAPQDRRWGAAPRGPVRAGASAAAAMISSGSRSAASASASACGSGSG
jgi:hypothetical protein